MPYKMEKWTRMGRGDQRQRPPPFLHVPSGDPPASPSMLNYQYSCFCFSRKFLSRAAEPPADVVEAFAAYADVGEDRGDDDQVDVDVDAEAPERLMMNAAQLLRFTREAQGESEAATLEEAERVVEQLLRRRHLPWLCRSVIGLEDFFHYLFSDELNPPIRSEVHQDMTLPLSQYYIYTGHNSYLTGNQLSSRSSGAPIIKALLRGVRVIELDMWPNTKKNNINILHGWTLTRPVKMIKCLRSIKEHAFVASQYPVVITLEDHLTPDLQEKAADMITQTFGDMLYYPKTDKLREFPSPEDLKMKIIISTKPPKEYLESNGISKKTVPRLVFNSFQEGEIEETKFSSEFNEKKTDKHEVQDQDEQACIQQKHQPEYISIFQKANAQNAQDQDDESSQDEKKGFLQNSTPLYKQLIAVPSGKAKGEMREVLKVDPERVRRLSLSEQKLAKAAESHGTDLLRFTQRNILRVYPRGIRLNSSNYDPLLGWMYGAQMVAFNMQGYGRSLWLMQGLFKANGGCGYVKKPDFLLDSSPQGEVFDPKASLPVKKILKVKVYMGDGWHIDFSKTHFDIFSPPDFYVRVGIAGVPADAKIKKTRTILDDWVPVWNEEFSFSLTAPELALLRIEVLDHNISDKDDMGGQTCLPVWELRPGIRAVPLYNKRGDKLKSVRLLMHFKFV